MEMLRDRLARHEGVRLKPYLDTAGKLTIGVGRCLDTKGITIEEAYHLLDNDIAESTANVLTNIPWVAVAPVIVREVLIEMSFQMGIHGLLAFRQTLSDLEAQNYTAAADSMLQSLWAKEVPSRAQELANLVKGAAS